MVCVCIYVYRQSVRVMTATASEVNPIIRRNRPGTKAADFCKWQDEPFEEMDSTLAVQQYIQQLIRKDRSVNMCAM